MDTPEGTGVNTHFAADAGRFIHNYRTCLRVPVQCPCGTDLQTKSCLALLTGHAGNGSFIQIDMHPDLGGSALESTAIVKRTDLFTTAAAQAPIGLDEYDFHDD